MQSNNIEKSVVTRGASVAKHRFIGGESLSYGKKIAHRSYRRGVNNKLWIMVLDPQKWEDMILEPPKTCMLTSRDVV